MKSKALIVIACCLLGSTSAWAQDEEGGGGGGGGRGRGRGGNQPPAQSGGHGGSRYSQRRRRRHESAAGQGRIPECAGGGRRAGRQLALHRAIGQPDHKLDKDGNVTSYMEDTGSGQRLHFRLEGPPDCRAVGAARVSVLAPTKQCSQKKSTGTASDSRRISSSTRRAACTSPISWGYSRKGSGPAVYYVKPDGQHHQDH